MDAPELRTILAANLQRMIDLETPRGAKPSVRAWALGKGLDVRMIDRIVKAKHAITLDKLEQIALACGLQPWHLLYDDLDPASPPDQPLSDDDRVMLERLKRLLGK